MNQLMWRPQFEAILSEVQYKNWTIEVVPLAFEQCVGEESALALRVRFDAPGDEPEQTGRKWYLSPHMTKSEVVLTALKAILTAEEHEARESFRYRGKLVAGPHLDVDFLADNVGRLANLDIRS